MDSLTSNYTTHCLPAAANGLHYYGSNSRAGVTGIMCLAIGVKDSRAAISWYKNAFGMDVNIFSQTGNTQDFSAITDDKALLRETNFLVNRFGGGGMKITRLLDCEPRPCAFTPRYGDLGIFCGKIKCTDLLSHYERFSIMTDTDISPLMKDPLGHYHFWVRDPFGNFFQVMESDQWYQTPEHTTGGVLGVVVGVKDMDAALPFYRDILGIREVIYDYSGEFSDIPTQGLYRQRYRRILLRKPPSGIGYFSRLWGEIQIELVQPLDRAGRYIYEGRHWGDCGFMHLNFEAANLTTLRQKTMVYDCPLTVDIIDYPICTKGNAKFFILSDPDKTLFMFSEPEHVPFIPELGLFISVTGRDAYKPLPRWMVKLMVMRRMK